MKRYINRYEFIDTFMKSDTYKNNFSYEGLSVLFDWLEEYEEGLEGDLEFDMVAICCDFSEYKNIEELKENYNDIEDMDDLENKTIVIMLEDEEGFIIQNF